MTVTGSISCPCCGLPLRGDESRCPVCRKRLLLPDWILLLAGFLAAALSGIGILASRELKTIVDARAGTPEEAYAVAQKYVERQPALQGSTTFEQLPAVEVQRWRGHRWRVAGQAASRDASGAPVRLLYSCVLSQDRRQWALEEIRIDTIR